MGSMEATAKEHCLRIFRDILDIHSEDALGLLSGSCRLENYNKGDIVFKPGDILTDCAFVVSGSLSDYVRFDDGRQIVECILCYYGDPAIPVSSLEDFAKPILVTMEALEPLTVLLIPVEVALRLVNDYPEVIVAAGRLVGKWNNIHRRMTVYNALPIAKRYESFKEMYPDLFERVPQNVIARLLNVSPAALSRALKA